MGARLHHDSLDEFIVGEARTSGDLTIGTPPEGVCVLRSEATGENLQRSLARDGVPVEETASFTTIEGVARDLLAEHHGRQPSIVDNRLLNRVLEEIITDARDADSGGPIADLADGLSLEEDLVEAIQLELEDYFICTDSGRSHRAAYELLDSVPDTFASHRARKTLDAFEQIHEELQRRLSDFPDHFYLNRSHLVTAAREQIEHWSSVYPTAEWLAMGSINVLDNPTIRLFAQLDDVADGPDLHFFFEAGSERRLRDRLEQAGVAVSVDQMPRSMATDGATQLFETATGSRISTTVDEDVTLVETPDRRRDVTQTAESIRELVADGVPPEDVLVIAEDLDEYRSIITDVFHTHEVPFSIETRTPMAHTVAYRFCKSALELIAPAEEPPSYTDLIDPLRLGFCLPDADAASEWPLDDEQFLRVEQTLSRIERERGRIRLEDWTDVVARRSSSDAADGWRQVEQFLDWVREKRESPPTSGEQLERLLDGLLDEHLHRTASDPVRSSPGPGVETARNDTDTTHQTYSASELRSRIDRVASFFDMSTRLLDENPDWELANRSLGDVVGSRDVGYPRADAEAIRFIEAENAYYRTAEHVFLIGVSAGEFPAERENKTFLHDEFRETIERTATSAPPESERAHLYLPTREIQYEQGLNRYETALSTVTGSLQISMHYLNSENDPVSWSPFVDLLPHDATEDSHVERITLSEWLPGKRGDERWFDVWRRVPERDRIRAYTFYTTSTDTGSVPRLNRADVQDLAIQITGPALETDIRPRRERYLTPPTEIGVDEGEPGFTAGPSLPEIVGEPFRPHEIDVFAQCQLKYYFYQYYFANDGAEVRREVSPDPSAFGTDRRFESLPAVLRRHSTARGFRDRLRRVIESELPDRATLHQQFDSHADLVSWARSNDLAGETDIERGLIQNLIYERRLVTAEHDAGIGGERTWSWVEDETIDVRGHEVLLPGHREDRRDDVRVPVFYTGEHGAARQAVKDCWDGNSRPDRCEEICEQCENEDSCSYPSKHVMDHRIHVSTAGRTTTDGFVFHDRGRSAPSARRGTLAGDARSLRLSDIPIQESVRQFPATAWETKTPIWQSELLHHLSEMKPTGSASYSVEDSFVADGGCEGCAYRELCQVPLREESD